MSSSDPSPEHVIENELLIEPPRTVATRWNVLFARGLFAVLTIIAPVGFIYGAYVSQNTLQALLDHGVKTTGRVIQKHAAEKDQSPSVVIQYEVDGATYTLSETRPYEVWRDTAPGSETSVTYLPESPDSAYTERQLADAGGSSPTAMVMWFMAGLLFVISSPAWLYVEWKYGRLRRLAQWGIPTTGRVTLVARWGSAKHDHWVVQYEFTPPGGTLQQSKSYVTGGVVRQLGDEPRVTLLMDPEKPKNFDLYAAVAKSYRIVEDEFSIRKAGGGFKSAIFAAAISPTFVDLYFNQLT